MTLMACHPDSAGTRYHWCPGCRRLHPLPATWSFNGDLAKPSFSPSFLQHAGSTKVPTCHYFITSGRIEFCADSDHDLAGQTIDMPDIPEGKAEKWGLVPCAS